MCLCVLLGVVGMLWQDALLDAAARDAANTKKDDADQEEPEPAKTEHDDEHDEGEDGEEEDVELDETVHVG